MLRPLLFLAVGIVALAGCSQKSREFAPERAADLNKIRAAYEQVLLKLDRPPENLNDIKPYLDGDPSDYEQRYAIVWGVDYRKATMPPPVIAYEKTAVNGQRYVVTALGVVPMSDEEFSKVVRSAKP